MRGWHELVADIGDRVPGGVPGLGMILLIIAVAAALLWYWFPEWAVGLGRGLVRLGRALAGMRWPWRRRRHRGVTGDRSDDPDSWQEEEPETADADEDELFAADELPEVPAAALALSADELAARGRYPEAVRERLRAIVRDLVERGVVEHRPGWTVTELAYLAGQARPAAAAPLRAATEIFSIIWYGQREGTAAHDAAMREHAGQVRAALDDQRVPA